MLLSIVDTDPERAAAVANEIVRVVDEVYSGYYKDTRKNMYESIGDKTREEDSSITALTDTLVALRNQYGIYDIISPARSNLIISPVKDNGNKNYGAGVEQIRNIESIKDQLVYDTARKEQTTLVKTKTRKPALPKWT